MESVPRGLDLGDLTEAVRRVPGVLDPGRGRVLWRQRPPLHDKARASPGAPSSRPLTAGDAGAALAGRPGPEPHTPLWQLPDDLAPLAR
jgi:hypothetical protein